MEKIIISNLDDLNSILDRLNNDENIDISDIDFNNLATVKIKVYGDEYNGELNSNIIHAMSNYHNELLKVNCVVRYRDLSLKKLSSEDKKLLTIKYEVNAGCTEIKNSIKELIESIGEAFSKMTTGMTPKQKTACCILTVLSVAGYFTISEALNYDLKKQDLLTSAQSQLDSQKIDVKKIETIQNGMLSILNGNKQAIEIATNTKNQSQQAYINTVKSFPDVTNIELKNSNLDVKLDKSEISSFVTTNKDKLITEEGTRELIIESIKRTPERLNIICLEIGSDYSFPLSVDLSFIEQDEIDLLFDSFKKSIPVKIRGDFKVRSGVIERANTSNVLP